MNLEEQIINTIQGVLDKKYDITPESRLLEDLKVDSLDLLMIFSGLEDEFSITIAEDNFLDVVTVKDIAVKLRARGVSDG